MTGAQGLSCGLAPWHYSASSPSAAPKLANYSPGRTAGTKFQHHFGPQRSRVRLQLAEAARLCEAASVIDPALAHFVHLPAWIAVSHGPGIRCPGLSTLYLGLSTQGRGCKHAVHAYSGKLCPQDLDGTISDQPDPTSGFGTTSMATHEGFGDDALTTVADRNAMSPTGVARDPDALLCNTIGCERASDSSITTVSYSINSRSPFHGVREYPQGGDTGAAGNTGANRDQRRAAGSDQRNRQSNWRLAWWDNYEREVQVAASEAVGTAAAGAIDAGPRSERVEYRRRFISTADRVRSHDKYGDRSDGHGDKGKGDIALRGAQSRKRQRLDDTEKSGGAGGAEAVAGVIPSLADRRKSAQAQGREPTAGIALAKDSAAAAAVAESTGQGQAPLAGADVVLGNETQREAPALQRPLQGPAGSEAAVHFTNHITTQFPTASRAVTDTMSPSAAIDFCIEPGATTPAEEANRTGARAGTGAEELSDVKSDVGEDTCRNDGPDVIPAFVDPDQERGRLGSARIEALYYIRELVLRRVTASADVRLLADALDWCLPLMDLQAVREAFRMIRTASVSVAFPRNSQLMPRPRFLSAFHFVARRLRCLLEVYGTGVMDWPYLLCVAGGMSAGRVRDRELMQILHDRGLEMLRQSEQARARWELTKQQDSSRQQGYEHMDAVGDAVMNGEGARVIPHACTRVDLTAADANNGPADDISSISSTRTASNVVDCGSVSRAATAGDGVAPTPAGAVGGAAGRRGRGRTTGGVPHVSAIGLRDLVCRFLLPLHHLGQAIDPEYMQLLEGMLKRTLSPEPPATSANSTVMATEAAAAAVDLGASLAVSQNPVDEGFESGDETRKGSVSEQAHSAWQPPPKFWLLRDVLELYSLVGAVPSPELLRGIREGCMGVAAELRAAASITVMMKTVAAAATPGGNEVDRSDNPGYGGGNRAKDNSPRREVSEQQAVDAGRERLPSGCSTWRERKNAVVKISRPWNRTAMAPGSTSAAQSTGITSNGSPASAIGGGGGEVRREYEVLTGTLASVLYLLSRVVRKCGGGVFFDGGHLLATTVRTEPSSASSSSDLGLSPSDLLWAHDALEALVPWMHTLTPLQLSGLLRTTVWLGAAERFLLPQPPPFPRQAGEGGVAAAAAAPATGAVAQRMWQPAQQRQHPTAFLRSYFLALSRAVSEQPTASTVTIGNVIEAAVGVAASGVAAYGVPREARDFYGKLLFRANAIMAYQATQRNGFLPPYALNLIPALAAAVRDAGSVAEIPAKLVAENLRLGERLLPGWHADGLAQLAAALETMRWVTPPSGWVDSLYAALAQRLHACVRVPTEIATAVADPWIKQDAHQTDADAQENAQMAVEQPMPEAASISPMAQSVQMSLLARLDSSSGPLLFHPPPLPDPLAPTSLMALLRAARHLSCVATQRYATPERGIAPVSHTDAGMLNAFAPGVDALGKPVSSAPPPVLPIGVMPEVLSECLASRLGHILAGGEGLSDQDLTDLALLCRQGTATKETSKGSSVGADAGAGGEGVSLPTLVSHGGASLDEATGDTAMGRRSLALLLLDALLSGAVEAAPQAEFHLEPLQLRDAVAPKDRGQCEDVNPAATSDPHRDTGRSSSDSSASCKMSSSPPSSGAASSPLVEVRTRHIILNALEQALALQLRRGHPAVATRGVKALSRSLEQVLGKPASPVWQVAAKAYLEARCDAALAEVRCRGETATGTAAAAVAGSPAALAFNVIQSAIDLLDFHATPAAGAGNRAVFFSRTLGPDWWREVSYSAGTCVSYFRKGREKLRTSWQPSFSVRSGTAGPGATTASSASPVRQSGLASTSLPPRPTSPTLAAHTAATATTTSEAALQPALDETRRLAVCMNPQRHPDQSEVPDLNRAVDLLIRYVQHLGRWLAATRVVEPVSAVETPSQEASTRVGVATPLSPLDPAAPGTPQGLAQQQQQQQYLPVQRSGGLLQPHIYFLVGLFSLLQPLLQQPALGSSEAAMLDTSVMAVQALGVSQTAKHVRPRGEQMPSRRSPVIRGKPGTNGDGGGGNGGSAARCMPANVSCSQLVRLAEFLACSRFQPLRFALLTGWPDAYLARVEFQLPLLSSADACMVIRALSCQGWRPDTELMDALLDRVTVDGGLKQVCMAYGPASLVQMLSWLAFARFLPAADWMDTLLEELGPQLDVIAMAGRSTHCNNESKSSGCLHSYSHGSRCSLGSNCISSTSSNVSVTGSCVGDVRETHATAALLGRSASLSSHGCDSSSSVGREVSDRMGGQEGSCTISSDLGRTVAISDSSISSISCTDFGCNTNGNDGSRSNNSNRITDGNRSHSPSGSDCSRMTHAFITKVTEQASKSASELDPDVDGGGDGSAARCSDYAVRRTPVKDVGPGTAPVAHELDASDTTANDTRSALTGCVRAQSNLHPQGGIALSASGLSGRPPLDAAIAVAAAQSVGALAATHHRDSPVLQCKDDDSQLRIASSVDFSTAGSPLASMGSGSPASCAGKTTAATASITTAITGTITGTNNCTTSNTSGSSTNTTNTNTSSSSTGLGLGELCVLGSALAELRYQPPRRWLDRALKAAGSAALAAAAATAGMPICAPDTTGGSCAGHDSSMEKWQRSFLANAVPSTAMNTQISVNGLPLQLAALLWRWAAVASATPGCTTATVRIFAGEMAAATWPFLSVMGPSDLVRCAEGMAALHQILTRQHDSAGSGDGGEEGDGDGDGASKTARSAALQHAMLGSIGVLGSISSCNDNLSCGGDVVANVGAMTGGAVLDPAVSRRADMLARSISLVLGYDSYRGELRVDGDDSGYRPSAHNTATGAATITATAGTGTGTAAYDTRTATTLGGDGRLALQGWWEELERASANVLLTRPPPKRQQPNVASKTQEQGQPEPQLKPYNLSVMLRCMATASHVPSCAWLQRYCQHTLPLLPLYKAQDLTVSMWAFAHMRLSIAGCATPLTHTASSTAAAAAASPGVPLRVQTPSCLPQAARGELGSWSGTPAHRLGLDPSSTDPSPEPASSSLAWSFIAKRTAHRRPSLGYQQEPQLQQPQGKPQVTAERVRAPPALGSWMEAAVGILPPLLRRCTSADLQNVAWALVTLDFPPPAGWLRQYELATEPRLPDLSGAALLYSLWAYGKFGHAPSTSYMDATLQALRPGMLGTASCLTCTVQGSTSPFSSSMSGPRRKNPLAVIVSAGSAALEAAPPPADSKCPTGGDARSSRGTIGGGNGRGGVVERLDAQSLALLLHSLAQLEYLPGEYWLSEYLQAVLKALPSMSATGLAILLRAAATLQIHPATLWMDAVVAAAGQRLPHFSDQQLESFMSAVTDLAPRVLPSENQLQRFLWACLAAAPDNRKVAAYYRLLASYLPTGPHKAAAEASTAAVEGGVKRTATSADTIIRNEMPPRNVAAESPRSLRHSIRASVPTVVMEAALPGSEVADRSKYACRLQSPCPFAAVPVLVPTAAATGDAGTNDVGNDSASTRALGKMQQASYINKGVLAALREDSALKPLGSGNTRRHPVPLRCSRISSGHQTVRPWRRGAAAARGPAGQAPAAAGSDIGSISYSRCYSDHALDGWADVQIQKVD